MFGISIVDLQGRDAESITIGVPFTVAWADLNTKSDVQSVGSAQSSSLQASRGGMTCAGTFLSDVDGLPGVLLGCRWRRSMLRRVSISVGRWGSTS